MYCNDCESIYRRAKYKGDKRYYPTGRFTLKKKVAEPRCPNCKSFNVRSDEANRKNTLAKQNTHMCSAYPFRHQAGTLRFCESHPKMVFFEEPTEEEHEYYQSILQRNRTGEDSGAGIKTGDLLF